MLVNEWTSYEEVFLSENYPKFGSKFCSMKLNRPVGGIRKRAKLLGIKFEKIKEIYHEEYFSNVIKNSKSISEVLDKLNLRKAGGNYGVINKYIRKYKLDISHFVSGEFKVGSRPKNKVNLSDILVINSSFSRTSLKKKLYSDGILKRECCLCGQDENWNSMKISLILDHINGVHNDNRLENLRIICPNCNAGLETFAGKNKNK